MIPRPSLFALLLVLVATITDAFVIPTQQRCSLITTIHPSPSSPSTSSPPFGKATTRLQESSNNTENKRPFWLDPNTKGGALLLMVVLFAVPYSVYQILVATGWDEIQAGITIGMGFTIFSIVAWMSTYLFRVATKDMTYAQQLKDYEDAVIQKRLEELEEDEVQALVEEVESDNF